MKKLSCLVMSIRSPVLLGVFSLLVACTDSTAPKSPASGASPSTPAVAPAAPIVTVLKWGPQTTKSGVGFGLQKSGNSALWFEQRGVQSAQAAEVWFDQTRLPGLVIKPNELGSVEVPPELLVKVGSYPVYLKLLPGGERVQVGTFEVTP